MREYLATFTASVLINLAAFNAVDRSVVHHESALRAQEQKEDALEKLGGSTHFEFVEAPPKTSARRPLDTGKVSDRDSVAQDETPEKDAAPREAPPKIENEGPADQLEQKRFDPSQMPAPALALSPPVPQVSAPSVQEPSSPTPGLAEEAAVAPTATGPQTELAALPTPSPARPPSPAQAPVAPKQGLTGFDRISTPASSREKSHGAQIQGATSFDATGSGMGAYMKNMKERIWLAWFPYLAFHYPMDFRAADAVIEFTLDADGRLRSVKTVHSEGSAVFAAFCVETVQRASPFGPLPPEVLDLMGRDQLEVRFAFHFW